MGSGHFLEEGVGKSSCFRNIQIVDASNNVKVPKGIGTFTEQSNCYDVQTGSNGDWGHSVYYGGPGHGSPPWLDGVVADVIRVSEVE
ncbi:hypothetical protein L1049_021025 [Liquidambar formosana]|uniref:Neprosin PEP catalytic domain-containing protein n=1 Tax=Liquidambar formosana TaxID=63359 RepID=A0AAP0SDZ7_LIQFO